MKYAIVDKDGTYWMRPTHDAEMVKRVAKHIATGANRPDEFFVLGIKNGVESNRCPLIWFCEHNGIEYKTLA